MGTSEPDDRTIGQIAASAGVSVRTLRHYDQIGLLRPGRRDVNGYRSYTEDDLVRLQQILAHRELGLTLDEIARVLAGPADRLQLLREARDRVTRRISRLEQISAGLERAVEYERNLAHKREVANKREGAEMRAADRLAAFEGFDPAEVADEAQRRWGETDSYQESRRRTSGYSEADWQRYRVAERGVYVAIAELRARGVAPGSAEAADAVEQHRALISEWFYDCTPQIHRSLGELYSADPRFAATIDRVGAGTAEYLATAIALRYPG